VHEHEELQTKLDSKSKHCIMVGYFDEFEVFKCHHPLTHKILINKDIKFDEQKIWHSFINSNIKPFISLEFFSNHSIVVKIIDPPISAFDHYFLQELIVDVVPNFFSTSNTKQIEHEKVAHQ
jgi:hypothetical protein